MTACIPKTLHVACKCSLLCKCFVASCHTIMFYMQIRGCHRQFGEFKGRRHDSWVRRWGMCWWAWSPECDVISCRISSTTSSPDPSPVCSGIEWRWGPVCVDDVMMMSYLHCKLESLFGFNWSSSLRRKMQEYFWTEKKMFAKCVCCSWRKLILHESPYNLMLMLWKGEGFISQYARYVYIYTLRQTRVR